MKEPTTHLTGKPGQESGMATLRDHFAIIALTQIIATKPHESAERKALEAYQIADSMMRQRGRSISGLSYAVD